MPKENDIDVERCITASTRQSPGCQTSSEREVSRHCTLAIQHLEGPAILINAYLKEEDNGNLIFSSAKQEIIQALNKSWHQRLMSKLLMSLVVGTAQIQQIIHCTLPPTCPEHGEKSPNLPDRVYLQDFTPDPLLTEALHNPHLLLCWRWAPYSLDVDAIEPSTHDDPTMTNTTIIAVKTVIDKTKIAWLLIFLLLLSPTLGIGVGLCARNAEVGIALSAGVFALASFAQGLIAWMQG